MRGAVDQREERIVPPHADVRAGVDARTALTHEDVPGPDMGTREHLDAAPLTLAVAAVARAALPLLVRHGSLRLLYAISVTRSVVIDCRWPRRRR